MNAEKSSLFSPVVFAHEIGHVLGLADLYNSSNSDKLMYGYNTGSATGPTEADLNGYNVISGRHATHDFKYTDTYSQCQECDGIKTESHHYSWSQYSSTKHKGVCTDSGCEKTVYELHYHHWGAGRCKRCAYRGTVPGVQGFIDYPITQ